MRYSILPLLLCAGTMALCQPNSAGAVDSGSPLQAPPAASPFAGFGTFSTPWQPGPTNSAKKPAKPDSTFSIQTQTMQWDKSQTSPQFQWQFPDAAGASTTQLMAQNNPFIWSPLRKSPNANGVPLPGQWPNLKKEPIPTRWPKLEFMLVEKQPVALAPFKPAAR
jgi:hypothetical protein